MHSILESEGNWGRVAWDYLGIILALSPRIHIHY